ncbi:hypothetical protein COV13_03945 [Candidatus Woesearchaeota archaeon CG10_big_fil_rev_8_21_14_0_10_32_9]|nr:MAG: hypothetical protein COV13_03945 [Candidatus Woesearchaeota archaeon CG10_big_fil_rev_8_21_14_0_10_32_9]
MNFLKLVLIQFLLVLFFASFVSANDFDTRTYLDINSVVSVPISFLTTGNNPELDILIVNYTWMPREDYRQQIKSLYMSPTAENHDTYALFKVYDPVDFTLFVNFTTRTSSNPLEINDKIAFPIDGLGPSLIQYTEPSELIDITPEIRKIANDVAAGEDDLYVVAFKLADWVNTNIEYNLSTTTAEADLPASWVLREKQGVCDELSNLYIAMARSLGIPARFVSGIAYTESELFSENWGAHGWAEVYFPGHGWVPFDVTYNQLGFLDATHIKIDDGSEGEKYSVKYTWKSNNIKVQPGEFSITSAVANQGSAKSPDVGISVDFFKDEVNLGSYNVITAEVENLRDYYVARTLFISRTSNLEIVDEEIKDVLLKPHEKKTVSWILKVSDSISSNFIYTFPVNVYTSFSAEDQKDFTAKKGFEDVSLASAENFAGLHEDVFVPSFDFSCSILDNIIYVDSDATINCNLVGEEGISGTICLESECEDLDSPTYSQKYSLKVDTSTPGFKTLSVDVKSSKGSASYFLTLKILDDAKLDLIDLTFPESISFDGDDSINFKLEKTSDSTPVNVSVKLDGGLFEQSWVADSIYGVQDFALNFKGLDLNDGDNKFKITVDYFDEKGKKFSEEKDFSINMNGLNLWQKFLHWFRII